jgi:SHS2 domain-containing protein
MKKWIIREEKNIADILIEVYGKDEYELLNNIIQAFTSIITDLKKMKLKEKLSFKIKANNLADLVFYFVERLIYFKDVKDLLFKKGAFSLEKNRQLYLSVNLLGEKISQNLPVKIDIKALTRHKFAIEKNIYYKAVMVFDI